MTLPNNLSPVARFVGNGTSNVFPFDFRLSTSEQVKVTVYDPDGDPTLLDLDVDYDVNYAIFPVSGGFVTLVDADQAWLTPAGKLLADWIIFIELIPDTSQQKRFRDYGPHAPVEIEKSLDQVMQAIISLTEKINRALTIPGSGEDIDATLPPLIGNARKILRVADDETGYVLGPTVDEVFTARDDAIQAKDEAEAAATGAGVSQVAAAASAASAAAQVTLAAAQVSLATAAALAAADQVPLAAAQVTLAAAQVTLATTQAGIAHNWALASEASAQTTLYSTITDLDSTDSPFAITNAHKNTIFRVDTTLGNFTFSLPDMTLVDTDFKFACVKIDASANTIQINRAITDTINGAAFVLVSYQNFGNVVRAKKPGTDWESRAFIMESAGGSTASAGYLFNTTQTLADGDQIDPLGSAQQWLMIDSAADVSVDDELLSGAILGGSTITLENVGAFVIKVPTNDIDNGFKGNGDVYLGPGGTVTMVWDEVNLRLKQIGGNGL